MRKVFLASAVIALIGVGAAVPAAQADTYTYYQTYRTVPMALEVPVEITRVITYSDNLNNAMNLLQQAENELRVASLRDDNNRNDALRNVRQAQRDVSDATGDNR